MTDSRLPGRWLTDDTMDSLSDRAWRTFTGSLMWSNEQGTDGAIPTRSLRFLHPLGVDAPTTDELVAARLWTRTKTGVQVRGWVEIGQETAAKVQQRREANRLKSSKYRSKKGPAYPGDVTGDVTGVDEGQDRRGQDRTGQALDGQADQGKVTSWPTAVPGSGQRAS